MSSSFNKVIMLGTLAGDPEVRYTESGKAITSFSVALNDSYKDASGNYIETVCFARIKFFGRSGEAFAKFHKKGDRVAIEGKLATEKWTDKESGKERSATYVFGQSWTFALSKAQKDLSEGGVDPQHPPVDDLDELTPF